MVRRFIVRNLAVSIKRPMRGPSGGPILEVSYSGLDNAVKRVRDPVLTAREISWMDELSRPAMVQAPLKRMQAILPVVFLALSIVAAQAQQPESGIVKLPEQIEFKGLPGAFQIATLFGDPTKAGVFVQR